MATPASTTGTRAVALMFARAGIACVYEAKNQQVGNKAMCKCATRTEAMAGYADPSSMIV